MDKDKANLLGQIKEKDRKIEQDLETIKVIVAERLPSLMDSVQLHEASVKSLLELIEYRDLVVKQFILEAGHFVRSLEKNAILVSQLRAVQYPVEGFGTEHDQLEGLLIRISSRLEKSERSLSLEQESLELSANACEEVSTKLSEVNKKISELEDKIKNEVELEISLDEEIRTLEQQVNSLDGRLSQIQVEVDDQRSERAKRAENSHKVLVNAQLEYEAASKKIDDEESRCKERINNAKKKLDEVLEEIETISKKVVDCKEEELKISREISDIEQNSLSGLWQSRDAAREQVAEMISSVSALRDQADFIEMSHCRLDRLIGRFVQACYSRADYLNKTFNESAVITLQNAAENTICLPRFDWSADDYVLHDPRGLFLQKLNDVQQALKLYDRKAVVVKHSTAQTDFQLEDVSDMERICKGRLCEAIATEIYEITRSLEQTRAQKCCHEEQPNGPVRGAIFEVDFNKLPAFNHNNSSPNAKKFPRPSQDFSGPFIQHSALSDRILEVSREDAIVISSESEHNYKQYSLGNLMCPPVLGTRSATIRSVKQERDSSQQQQSNISLYDKQEPISLCKQGDESKLPTKTDSTPTSALKRTLNKLPCSVTSSKSQSSQLNVSSFGQKRQMAMHSIQSFMKEDQQSSDDSGWVPPSERQRPARKTKKSQKSALTSNASQVSRVEPVTSTSSVKQGAPNKQTETGRAPKQRRLYHPILDSNRSLTSDIPILSITDSD
ncbi:myosin heavy chain, cardiac muscle isoform-like [Varroa destructor]|uniref:Uncharacterized protein n=1 Tax=Varroa destructor TaxID=109461 RepID=A0A7M7JVQ9_VARDE|nr:myosin heavy chain, cardiac muscle isoform-like [Varroa destructor]